MTLCGVFYQINGCFMVLLNVFLEKYD